MTLDLDKLEQLAAAATFERWELAPRAAKYKVAVDSSTPPHVRTALEGMESFDALSVGTSKGSVAIIPLDESTLENAAFIAATNPAVVLELVRRLRAAEEDAARWRAFLGSQRIRPLGSAGLDRPEPNNYAHMGFEIWTVYGRDYRPELLEKMDTENEKGRRWLTQYADVARAAQGGNHG